MEPAIHYAQTSDGVRIAFSTQGEGPPYVLMPGIPFSHMQLERQVAPELAGRLAVNHRTTVRYDNRGSGSSDRNIKDWSLTAHVRDLEAVADALDLQPFVLWAYGYAGPVAISYAARYPERVSHLILWCSWAGPRDLGRPTLLLQALVVSLLSRDWNFFTQSGASSSAGSEGGHLAYRLAAVLREAVTPQQARKFMGLRGAPFFNATRYLPQVRAPTLVMHRQQVPFPKEDIARHLASRIPGARLVLLEGDSFLPSLGNAEAVRTAVNEFLGEDFYSQAGEEVEAAPAAALAVVLFTDIEGSTSLTQRLGDERAQELVRAHNMIVRAALKGHGGTEIKHTGDGIMASFSAASSAIECAVAIQRAVVERPADPPLLVRIGLNAGEPVVEEQDLFGTSVQLARRICDAAKGGEIFVSDVVRQLTAGKLLLFSDQGALPLKGFEDPVRVYEVRWREG